MLFSYNWLQEYFEKPLPSPEKLADLFTFHFSEVEGVEKKNGDTIFDIKILPDRACYALSHSGVAYELGALLDQKPLYRVAYNLNIQKDLKPHVRIESERCQRYMARTLQGVMVGESDDALKKKLAAINQRPINSVVDLMNYVMFDIGQPLHAFDADLVEGSLVVREAHHGEKITTLDGTEVTLKKEMIVIADDKGPLAIAGIKGGNRAAVTDKTKNIIIESASFDVTTTRRTSTAIGIRTDASKRFENNLSAEVASRAMDYVTHLIVEKNPNAVVGAILDEYPHSEKPVTVSIAFKDIAATLGADISDADVGDIFRRLEFGIESDGPVPTLTIPYFRKDIRHAEDVIEDVARMYGYDKIPSTPLTGGAHSEGISTAYYYEQLARHTLADLGFSEVYTPTLVEKGDVVIENPLASDKGALRTGLEENLAKSLALNTHNAILLGLNAIKIFEIGAVFPKNKEVTMLGIAVNDLTTKGKKNHVVLDDVMAKLSVAFGVEVPHKLNKEKNVVEISLSDLISKLPLPTTYTTYAQPTLKMFTPFSIYPFISRDIALFVPESVSEKDIETTIRENAGTFCMRVDCFDRFPKDGKVSYAFRLVFQSPEKTLTDQEVSDIMKTITDAVIQKGWQVR